MAVEIAKKGRNFVSEVVDELKKVTWADWSQLKNATLVIIVFIIIVSLIIFAMDWVVRLLIGPTGLIMRLIGS
jgi:preprotein translocase SecE subunit